MERERERAGWNEMDEGGAGRGGVCVCSFSYPYLSPLSARAHRYVKMEYGSDSSASTRAMTKGRSRSSAYCKGERESEKKKWRGG